MSRTFDVWVDFVFIVIETYIWFCRHADDEKPIIFPSIRSMVKLFMIEKLQNWKGR